MIKDGVGSSARYENPRNCYENWKLTTIWVFCRSLWFLHKPLVAHTTERKESFFRFFFFWLCLISKLNSFCSLLCPVSCAFAWNFFVQKIKTSHKSNLSGSFALLLLLIKFTVWITLYTLSLTYSNGFFAVCHSLPFVVIIKSRTDLS